MDPLIERIIVRKIDEALQKHRASDPNPIRNELPARARSGGGYNGDVRIVDESGQPMTIDEAIEKLRDDPRFQNCFPQPPKVSMKDEKAIHDNFDKIRRGEVAVVW